MRQQHGHFDLAGRDDLWKVLVTITLRKVRNLAKYHQRERRDYRRDQAEADAGAVEALTPEWVVENLEGSDPSPAVAAVLTEEFERRLRMLPESLRQIALWKLEGYTTEEIAGSELLNCAPRTVRRKLERIREKSGLPADRDSCADDSA